MMEIRFVSDIGLVRLLWWGWYGVEDCFYVSGYF